MPRAESLLRSSTRPLARRQAPSSEHVVALVVIFFNPLSDATATLDACVESPTVEATRGIASR